MGSSQSTEKLHCNRYLDGHGPPSLLHQANVGVEEICRVSNGSQPQGQMTWVILHRELPGFSDGNTLQINYIFPDGVQTEKHPSPGQPHAGLRLCAYLPDNREGWKVLKQMEKAFNQQMLFTVATNLDGSPVITPTIPLKTNPDHSANTEDGYPDPHYLKTVRQLLKDKGFE
ncbi:E3 ubiquitin-protein ligase DTX3L1 [Synchiropus splendidus]|uniref:E3 ubiquitin-protein ligase DTX3L1 n=1 Tax=Synchiropus splendidus TaxID=270530 RepID=UPI00237EB405|nr:E3 ubiquitin-protein ligase DTX3L1 [Synchiropus splendidus]